MDTENTKQELLEHIDSLNLQINKRQSMINEFESALKEDIAEGNLDGGLAEAYASIFGFSLETVYNFTITVTFSGSVTVPLGQDIDDLESNLSASLDTGYSDFDLDWSEDGIEVDYYEA